MKPGMVWSESSQHIDHDAVLSHVPGAAQQAAPTKHCVAAGGAESPWGPPKVAAALRKISGSGLPFTTCIGDGE